MRNIKNLSLIKKTFYLIDADLEKILRLVYISRYNDFKPSQVPKIKINVKKDKIHDFLTSVQLHKEDIINKCN